MHACADCVKHVWTPDGFVDECPRCKVVMKRLTEVADRLAARAASPEPGAAAYLARLPEFLVFPARRSVLLMILGLTVFTGPLYWAVGANYHPALVWTGILVIKALEASVYFRMVTQTAYGEREISPPDVTDLADDLAGPLVRYLVATLPILAAAMWYGEARFDSMLLGILSLQLGFSNLLDYPGPAVLMAAGIVLLPLLTVIAAVSRSALAVANPALWVHSLRVLGTTYPVAVVAFYAMLGFEVFALGPVLVKLQLEYSIPVVTTFIALFAGYLAMALRARLLGGLCEPYFRELDG
jgi:hypothetical protein